MDSRCLYGAVAYGRGHCGGIGGTLLKDLLGLTGGGGGTLLGATGLDGVVAGTKGDWVNWGVADSVTACVDAWDTESWWEWEVLGPVVGLARRIRVRLARRNGAGWDDSAGDNRPGVRVAVEGASHCLDTRRRHRRRGDCGEVGFGRFDNCRLCTNFRGRVDCASVGGKCRRGGRNGNSHCRRDTDRLLRSCGDGKGPYKGNWGIRGSCTIVANDNEFPLSARDLVLFEWASRQLVGSVW